MTSFNLDTRTPEHKAAAERVIKELQETFGKENVISENWKLWVLVEIKGIIAYFNGACSSTCTNSLMLSMFEKGKTKKTYEVSGDLIDTIYIL